MNFNKIFEKISLEDIRDLVVSLLKGNSKKKLFCLYGDLGAGKTTFSKEIIKQLTGVTTVTSPTFNIVQTYEGRGNFVYHYDLYRLRDESELYEIGLLENITDNVYTIIEWPEIAEKYISGIDNRLNLQIEIDSENSRSIKIL